MARKTEATRSARRGLGLGILAGILFAIIEVLAAVLMGNPPLMPLRMFASILMGPAAMEAAAPGTVLLASIPTHLVLSALYGLVYAAVNARLPAETRRSWARQAALGLGFGALLWLLNFQVIARVLFPWFLGAPQLLQLVMHAAFFGLPLGLMLTATQRRLGRERAEAPA